MLFTACAYIERAAGGWPDLQPALDKLGPLVRCPHLTQFWLHMGHCFQMMKACCCCRRCSPS